MNNTEEIDGVKVTCIMAIETIDIASFKVCGTNIIEEIFRFEMTSNGNQLTELEIECFINKINNEILPNLRLQKNGKLDLPSEEGKECNNEENACSTCREITQTKTPCEHWLCNRCLSNIKLCPICEECVYCW